jgi:hypothetical protein
VPVDTGRSRHAYLSRPRCIFGITVGRYFGIQQCNLYSWTQHSGGHCRPVMAAQELPGPKCCSNDHGRTRPAFAWDPAYVLASDGAESFPALAVRLALFWSKPSRHYRHTVEWPRRISERHQSPPRRHHISSDTHRAIVRSKQQVNIQEKRKFDRVHLSKQISQSSSLSVQEAIFFVQTECRVGLAQ